MLFLFQPLDFPPNILAQHFLWKQEDADQRFGDLVIGVEEGAWGDPFWRPFSGPKNISVLCTENKGPHPRVPLCRPPQGK